MGDGTVTPPSLEHISDRSASREVEQDGRWWPRLQRSWGLLDERRGWLADVEYVVAYDWGHGSHLGSVPAERVRLT